MVPHMLCFVWGMWGPLFPPYKKPIKTSRHRHGFSILDFIMSSCSQRVSPTDFGFLYGGKRGPHTKHMGRSEISVGIDVCYDTVKYYNLDTKSHISSHFAREYSGRDHTSYTL